MKKLSILLVVAALGLAACGSGGGVAATVNGVEIRVADVEGLLDPADGTTIPKEEFAGALGFLVQQQIVTEAAESELGIVIEDSEIDKLEGVASAMARLLEDNPGETFLIEGHTDAVGSEVANLALSDQRAEAVAEALTNVFDIPPENLAPQGYGEQYLKVNTEERERENRRVAIRRITPLVKPVASAQ